MIKLITAAAAALALLAQPCLAQTAAPDDKGATSAPVDPARLAAARRFMTAAHIDDAMSSIMTAMVPRFTEQEGHSRGLSSDQIQMVSTVVQQELLADLPELVRAMTQLYALRFSEADLNAIADFYESEAGRHFVAAQGPLAEEGAAIGQAWSERLQPRVEARIRALSAATPQVEHP